MNDYDAEHDMLVQIFITYAGLALLTMISGLITSMRVHAKNRLHPEHTSHTLIPCTADPTWGDIFECYFKAQSSKLERLFSLKRDKRNVRALSFELSKMSP